MLPIPIVGQPQGIVRQTEKTAEHGVERVQGRHDGHFSRGKHNVLQNRPKQISAPENVHDPGKGDRKQRARKRWEQSERVHRGQGRSGQANRQTYQRKPDHLQEVCDDGTNSAKKDR